MGGVYCVNPLQHRTVCERNEKVPSVREDGKYI